MSNAVVMTRGLTMGEFVDAGGALVPLIDLGLVGPVDARGTLTLPCGCDVGRDGTIAYALMTCSEKHFSAYCDRKLGLEHTRTHKRRRKGCKFCNGAALP